MEEQDKERAESEELIISVGMLDLLVLDKPAPLYPKWTEVAGLRGRNVVEVLVDESGNVVKAVVLSGHPVMKEVVIKAAMKAKFKPTLVNGKHVKVSGILMYDLVDR